VFGRSPRRAQHSFTRPVTDGAAAQLGSLPSQGPQTTPLQKAVGAGRTAKAEEGDDDDADDEGAEDEAGSGGGFGGGSYRPFASLTPETVVEVRVPCTATRHGGMCTRCPLALSCARSRRR
jgi:hypothetical protein